MTPRILITGLLGTLVLSAASHAAPYANSNPTDQRCKFIPGDPGWPSQRQWASLNATVGGRLVGTQLQASICHTEAIGTQPIGLYDEAECAALREVYDLPQNHQGLSAEILNPYFQGTTCSPWTPPDQPCELGNYVSYAINISAAGDVVADVVAGIEFARQNNVRLIIKNTGHDYSGRSTGKGALSLWMHNLQGYEIIQNYTSRDYTGPAVRLAAGTQGYQAMEYVSAAGYRIVGGECPTVGISGGYTSGGGHSLLNSKYGMAADSVLEWEVVTPQGERVIATPDGEYSDLFWAMNGGGGGTWGVALSMTTKIYPEGIVAGAHFSFNATGVSTETYWNATARLYAFMLDYTDRGNTLTWGQTNNTFSVLSATMPDQDATDAAALWAPLLQEFDSLGVMYTFEPRTDDSYYDHFNLDYGPLPYGNETAATSIFTSRILPRTLVADPSSSESRAFMDVLEYITNVRDARFTFGCHAMSVGNWSGIDNAVLSAWRDAMAICVIVTPWLRDVPFEEMLELKEFTMDDLVPTLENATPGGAVYMNEIDPLYHGDWKTTGYGDDKYDRLLAIKKKYDPHHVFWSPMSVGGDEFRTDADGRVCRA
ncbi:hypothetical protein DL768_007832 [Monosporascus sp. mg162]|nr:hypothetical protein DL768_007832 [Monosporascus sp. mg162]